MSSEFCEERTQVPNRLSWQKINWPCLKKKLMYNFSKFNLSKHRHFSIYLVVIQNTKSWSKFAFNCVPWWRLWKSVVNFLLVMVFRLPTLTTRNPKSILLMVLRHLYKMPLEAIANDLLPQRLCIKTKITFMGEASNWVIRSPILLFCYIICWFQSR